MKNIPLSFIVLLCYVSVCTYVTMTHHPLYALLYLPVFVLVLADFITRSSNGNILFIRTIWFLLTGKIKRVKTSFGRFYITNRNTKSHVQLIELYQDRFFFMREIGSHNYDTTENLKAWIKSIYDKKYQDREAIRSKEKEIKKWNGYIDIQDQREAVINEVIN